MNNLKSIENAISKLSLKTTYMRNTPESIAWFRKYVTKNLTKVSHHQFMSSGIHTLHPKPGFLYTYAYDPKHKDSLPYYDQFPLILCVDVYKDGWLGINLHYMPPAIRQIVFIELLKTLNNTAFDEKTKFKVNWTKLKHFIKHRFIAHSCKRYLSSQLKTPLCKIDPEYWEVSIFLPIARFQKASIKDVWKDI